MRYTYSKSFFLFWLRHLCCCVGLSAGAGSGGCFLAVMHGLLVVVGSLIAEHRL